MSGPAKRPEWSIDAHRSFGPFTYRSNPDAVAAQLGEENVHSHVRDIPRLPGETFLLSSLWIKWLSYPQLELVEVEVYRPSPIVPVFDGIRLIGRMAIVLSKCEERGLDVVRGDGVAVNSYDIAGGAFLLWTEDGKKTIQSVVVRLRPQTD